MEQRPTALGPGSASHDWRDAASFIGAPHWTSGRHTIDSLGENRIVLDVRPAIAARKRLVAAIVFLSDAKDEPGNYAETYLEKVANQVGPHLLIMRGTNPSGNVMEIMSELRGRLNGPILFVGCGKHALAAIALSNQLEGASALVVNPTSFPSDDTGTQKILNPPGDSAGKNRAARVFIFQSITADLKMKEVARYLDAHDFTHRGNGLYVNDKFQAFLISRLDSSDRGAFDRLLQQLLTGISDPSRSPRSLYNEILERDLIPRDFSALPMDLRDLWDAGKISTQITVTADEMETHVDITMGEKPRGYGALKMEVALIRGGQSIVRQELTGGQCSMLGKGDSVEVKFTDGFGHYLGTKSVDSHGVKKPLKTRIFILGSCVSRDAFDLQGSPELVDYRARTALGSAFATRTKFIDNVNLELNPSAFQRRMVVTDLDKQLDDLLIGSSFDFLLLDLIDERLQMIRHDSSYVTFSPELQTCGVMPNPKDLVEVGSAEYFEAFVAGLEKLLAIVPADKIIVNEVYWAENTLDGELVGSPDQTQKHNRILDRLYRQLRRQPGMHFIAYDRSDFVSDPQHKWGPSPFHFGPNLYERTIRGIERVANGEQ
ncbi:DUF6270 domain-containing protein [Pseudarthrobacter sp. H2]|uniref:DUF6270 domain-containing protein n=1 Tax=Pseudarthrobacter sp. H2 TaxID=3418415 RepID=UPI003CECBD4A